MLGMLARAAENIYWLGRYIERAESVARMLQIVEQLSIEIRGLDPKLALSIWDDLLRIYPGSGVEPPGTDDPDAMADAFIRAFLISSANPLSLAYSIRSARENARVIRDNLPMESFVLLNETHLRLDAFARDETIDRMRMRPTACACDRLHAHAIDRAGACDLCDRACAFERPRMRMRPTGHAHAIDRACACDRLRMRM